MATMTINNKQFGKNAEYTSYAPFKNPIRDTERSGAASRMIARKLAGMRLEEVPINAANVGLVVLPLVEYIRELKPDFIIACDRGARLIGFAVFQLYENLYGTLPTKDGTLRFARISGRNDEEQTEEHLKPLVKEILRRSDSDRPTVLVLDDWVGYGRTKRVTNEAIEKLSRGKIRLKFGVLRSGNADVTGTGTAGGAEWGDNPELIGVDYKDGDFAPVVFGSQASRNYRSEIVRSIEALVGSAREESK